MRIDADGLHYRDLNDRIHASLAGGATEIMVDHVRGQRYLGAGLGAGVRLIIHGVPGNDLGVLMNGAEITVEGNAQDGVGNTMNAGKIVVRGDAGDIIGHSLRGGRIFIRGHVGYRTGIHMKAFRDQFPVVVVGTTARDYLGEYMAGGIIAVLNLDDSDLSPVGEYVGTGMHAGVIYVRGRLEPYQLGKEVGMAAMEEDDWAVLRPVLAEFCQSFALEASGICPDDFVRLAPRSTRPYGRLYAY